MSAPRSVDIAALQVGSSSGLTLEHFRGAVIAAERLGFRVTVREIRGPGDYVHSLVATATEAP